MPSHTDVLIVPQSDLLSILFSDGDIPDDKVIWRDGMQTNLTLTKAQGRTLVRRIAHGYATLGLLDRNASEQGVIIVCSENQLIGFPHMLAIIAANGVMATCHYQSSVEEVLFRINMVKPNAIVCSHKTKTLIQEARSRSHHPFEILLQDSEAMDIQKEDGSSIISSQGPEWKSVWNENIANKPCVLVFSSGTTGSPKGVCISQKNIISMIFQIREVLRELRDEVRDLKMIGVLDSAHVAGMFINTFCALGVGIENIFVPGTETSVMLRSIAQHRAQIFLSVPPIVTRMLDDPSFNSRTLQSLRYAAVGAAPTTVEIQKRFSDAMRPGSFLEQGWGMTELTLLATMPVLGVKGPWQSVGKPLLGNKVKIMRTESVEAEKSEEGEIWVSGPSVTNGYYLAPNQVRNSKKGEWFPTGDIGRLDDNGYLYILGRNKDLIKYNGVQVSPSELEGLIRQFSEVGDVGVVGMELPDGNELPTAFVTLNSGHVKQSAFLEQILQFVASRVSPSKKLRGGVHILQEIPKNAMGKISYKDLRNLAKNLRSKDTLMKAKI